MKFEHVTLADKDTIFQWLKKPHMKEFWDNTESHKEDILNFMNGRIEPSTYFNGVMTYWIGSIDNEPFCFILTSDITPDDTTSDLWKENVSKTGTTYSVDFGIGNEKFLGQGLAAPTLEAFTEFFRENIDPKADTFLIDPADDNPRAKHVYAKAGFKFVGDFVMEGEAFKGEKACLMVKTLLPFPILIKASLKDYPIIQNLARFSVYDMSRFCGFISEEWVFPTDGLYESFDFKNYFLEDGRHAFLVKVDGELAGFALLNKIGTEPNIDWNMGEFFIIAKFQGKGIAQKVAHQIWEMYPGLWEISVIPENMRALGFWRKSISAYIGENYKEEIKKVDFDSHQPLRHIFSFDTKTMTHPSLKILIRKAKEIDIDEMVALSYEKRRNYEKIHPQFWRYAKGAEKAQGMWFKELLTQDDYILLIAESGNKIVGFIIGHIIKAPDVYDQGGLTVMIDDFCVGSPIKWNLIGGSLLTELKRLSKMQNGVQFVIVCGAHDAPKRYFLENFGLKVASEWYVGGI